MYVEVSSRQSGKTSRLLDDITVWLSQDDNQAFLCTMNKLNFDRIFRKLNFNQRIRLSYLYDCDVNNFITDDPRIKYYFDEFDFISENRLKILQNGYYCTTAKIKRNLDNDDFFTKLVSKAKKENSFHEFKSSFRQEDLNRLYKYLGHEDYNLEVRNIYYEKINLYNRNGANER